MSPPSTVGAHAGPKQLILPLLQHIGARAEPVVAVASDIEGALAGEASGVGQLPTLHAAYLGYRQRYWPAPYRTPRTGRVGHHAGNRRSDQWTELAPSRDYGLWKQPLAGYESVTPRQWLGGAGSLPAVKFKARPEQKAAHADYQRPECSPLYHR